MKNRLSIAALFALLLAGCTHAPSSTGVPPQIISGNIQGVGVTYDGSTGELREADMQARHHCERYQRNAALINDAPLNGGGGSLAYYACQ